MLHSNKLNPQTFYFKNNGSYIRSCTSLAIMQLANPIYNLMVQPCCKKCEANQSSIVNGYKQSKTLISTV